MRFTARTINNKTLTFHKLKDDKLKYNDDADKLEYIAPEHTDDNLIEVDEERVDYLYLQLLILNALSQRDNDKGVQPSALHPDKFKFNSNIECALEKETTHFKHGDIELTIRKNGLSITSENPDTLEQFQTTLQSSLSSCDKTESQKADPHHAGNYMVSPKNTVGNKLRPDNLIRDNLKATNINHGAAEVFYSSIVGNESYTNGKTPILYTANSLPKGKAKDIHRYLQTKQSQPGVYSTLSDLISEHVNRLINELTKINAELGNAFLTNTLPDDFEPETGIIGSRQQPKGNQYVIQSLFGPVSAQKKARKIMELRTLLDKLDNSHADEAQKAIEQTKQATLTQAELGGGLMGWLRSTRTKELLEKVEVYTEKLPSSALFSPAHTTRPARASSCPAIIQRTQ